MLRSSTAWLFAFALTLTGFGSNVQSAAGTVRVSGTIQVPFTQKVPEPTNTAALIGMGMIGVGFGLRRHRHKAA